MNTRQELEQMHEGDLSSRVQPESERERERAEMEAMVAEFLKSGGTIEKVESHVCTLREAGKQKGRSSVLRAQKSRQLAGNSVKTSDPSEAKGGD